MTPRPTRYGKDAAGGISILMVNLLLLGALGWLLLGGNDTAFLHPRFRPFLAAGAVILCGFAAAAAMAPGTAHPHARWWAAAVKALVLATPVLFMGILAGQSLGVQALSKKTVSSGDAVFRIFQETENGAAGDTGGTLEPLSLLQIARNMKQLDGRAVITDGMVYSDDNMPARYLLLFRFGIYCCAADAIPVWVLVDKGAAPAIENERWIRVTGTLRVTPINGRDLPVITADDIRITQTPPPESQYLFF